jgi:dethiobiotin synthetase
VRAGVSRETRPVRIAVVGTGTAVGKTHATRALATALARSGTPVAALKPIESGVQPGSRTTDFALLARAANVAPTPPLYAFPDPVSPHLAARRAGRPVHLTRVAAWVAAHAADWTFVETAGALLSPLSRQHTNLDLVAALRPDLVLLVGQDRLGVLHDIRACTLVLRATLPDIPLLVLLQAPARPDQSTGTNAAELARLRVVPEVVTLPRARRPADDSVQRAARTVLQALVRLARRPRRRAT